MVFKKSFIVILLMTLVSVSYATRPETSLSSADISSDKSESEKTAMSVFVRMQAKTLGEKTYVKLNKKSQTRLNKYARFILSQAEQYPGKNILHISNPDLHRMVCFFTVNYVYSLESQDMPDDLQLFVIFEEEKERKGEISLEIERVKQVFSKCERLELELQPSGIVYFKWDGENYLNGVSVALYQSDHEKTMTSEVPEVFKNDPLLAKLYAVQPAESVEPTYLEGAEDATVNSLLEGVKSQTESMENVQLGSIAKQFFKRTGKKLGKKLTKIIWKRRENIAASFTKDDADLFSNGKSAEDTAMALTNLVAMPNQSKVSQSSFVDTLKGILGSDAKLKLSVERRKIYAGFKLKFK
jgi:hypothetical protein